MSESIQSNYERIVVNDLLTLQQLALSDAADVFSLVDASREQLEVYLPWVESTQSPKDNEAFIAKTLEDRKTGQAYHYGMFFDNEVVGHISIMHVNDELEPEIGYWVTTTAAGKGITTEAVKALTAFGLEILGLDNIVIKAEPANIASNKVAEKSGYIYDGQEYSDYVGAIANNWRSYR
jgi:ribosomal-protein-serine acetyltransferase